MVTHDMMAQENMVRYDHYGVPLDPITGEGGLVWKELHELRSEDYDAIEDYFSHRSGL